ncbi:hypothetical protein [Embleya sp. NPDC020630]|uniref:hypothetical protein n=1 Tax=Embleya sp. NPDC020630 TaxID=3363979 RepID=UPI003787AE1B
MTTPGLAPRRRAVRVAGVLIALLATATIAAGTASATATARAGELFRCASVTPDLPNLYATSCDTDHWGPASHFVVVDQGSRNAWMCEQGWVEGSLWISGQNCRRLATSGA